MEIKSEPNILNHTNNNTNDLINPHGAIELNHVELLRENDVSQTAHPNIENASQVSRDVIEDDESDEFDLSSNLSPLIFESNDIKLEIFIKELIGKGVLGLVFKGSLNVQKVNDKSTIKQVAVKRMQKTDLSVANIKHMVELEHPNVIRTYHFDFDRSFVYQIMELCRGSLSEFMKLKIFRLTDGHKVDILVQIACGMNYIHGVRRGEGIVHRNLKPDNVVLNIFPETAEDLTMVVCKIINLSSDGGTMRYMSPEAAWFENFSKKSDVYAFGVLTWELLTEQQPFEGLTPEEILIKLLIKDNLSIAEKMKDHDLAKLMRHTWNRKVDKRPTFEDIIKTFESIKQKLIGQSKKLYQEKVPRRS